MKSLKQSVTRLVVPIALLSSLLSTAQTVPDNRTSPENSPASRQAQANYGKLPLTFEANKGQTGPQVKFLAHGSGYSVYLTSGQMVLSLRPSSITSTSNAPTSATAPIANSPKTTSVASQQSGNAIIQIGMVGANPNPAVAGENLRSGKANYFTGNDPKKWQTNVPLYNQVRYKSVYPGIDLVYYGNQSRVEHDFIVNPGADPGKIQLNVQGVDKLSIDPNGGRYCHSSSSSRKIPLPIAN
jgi:hypothetical protein